MAKLSSLIVDLQADTAALKQGLDEAKQMLGGLEKKVDQATKAIGAMFILDKAKDAVVGLAEFVRSGAEAADQAGKMAAAAGTSVESFSRLSYAASLADISNEELSTSLAKLNKQLGDAAQGGKQQVAMFSALGVSIKNANGSLRGSDEVLGDLADKFSMMEDGAGKAALAQEIFGKSGARLIPLLNQGRAGLEELGKEADKYGFTVSGKAAASAEEFNDSLTRFKKIGEGLARSIAADLTPSLSALSKEMLTSAGNTESLKIAAEGIAAVFRVLVSAGIVVAGILQHVGITIAALASAGTNLVQGNFAGAKEALRASAEEMGKNFDSIGARLKAVWTTTEETTTKEAKAHTVSADSIVKDMARKQKAMEDYQKATEKLTKLTEDLQFKALTFGFDDVELLKARMLFGDLSEEIKKAGKNGEKLAAQMLQAAQALHDLEEEKNANDAIAALPGGKVERPMMPSSDLVASQRKNALGPSIIVRDMTRPGEQFVAKIKEALSVMGTGILNGVRNATMGLLQSMGGIGSIIGNFVQTFQQEGFWEAIIGAIGEIIAAAPAFGDVVNIAAGILQYVVGALDGLIAGIGDLLGALGWVIEILINALSPLFEVIGQVLSDLAPLLYMMGMTIQVGITPIVKALATVFKVLSPILRALFEVIKVVVLISFYILKGIASVWNAIVSAISGILRTIGNFEIFGAKPFGFLLDWANTVDKAKITTQGLDDSIKDLQNANFDQVKEMQNTKTEEYKAAGATEKLGKAATDTSRAMAGLTNVPALLKVNRLRGLAQDNADGSMPTFNLYIDGKQVYTVVESWRVKDGFNKNGGRSGF